MKFACDGFARCDAFPKLYADWFFHCRVYAKFWQSCSRDSAFLRLRRSIRHRSEPDWHFQEKPIHLCAKVDGRRGDPSTHWQGPKGGTRCPQRIGKQRSEASGRISQRAADGRGNSAETRNELGEN